MGYTQGTGDLHRTKTTAAVTLGSSNSAASVAVNGTRGTLTVTLNGTLVYDAVTRAGPLTVTSQSIKADSVVQVATITDASILVYDVYAVQDGSFKFEFLNLTGGHLTGDPSLSFAYMVFN